MRERTKSHIQRDDYKLYKLDEMWEKSFLLFKVNDTLVKNY
jgi:hypothetical protein